DNPAVNKVVCATDGRALYFSKYGPLRPRRPRRPPLQARRPLRLHARGARGVPSPAALAARANREAGAAPLPRARHSDRGRRDGRAHDRRGHGGRPARRRSPPRHPPLVTRPPDADPATRRRVILTLIVLAQTVANIGPLGIPAIASLIRTDLGLP